MTTHEAELSDEQKYFDRAWEARETLRRNLAVAPAAALGPRAGTRAVRQDIKKRLEALPQADEAVAFGRIDLDTDETYYIGKQGISDENRDVLVVSWRLEQFADYFYRSSVREPLGVARKRSFRTERNEITAFEDTVFAELAVRVQELTEMETLGVDDVLLRDLDQARDGEMRDIVQTIHASQYDLIRRPIDQLLLIQGGPGTGKTAVALHRASWLLFNHSSDVTAEDVLVVVPSRTFGRYIRKVLPSLGDEGVAERDLGSLGPVATTGRREPIDVARIKGDQRMARVLQRDLRSRARFPERESQLVVATQAGRVVLGRAEVEAQLAILRERPTYNVGRAALRAWLGDRVQASLRRGSSVSPQAIDQVLDRIWPALTPTSFLQEFLASKNRILAAAGDLLTAGDVERLTRRAAPNLASEEWSMADVALLDEVDELINGLRSTYAHVIVDEAQDLSPMQLRSVRRRSSRGSYTIVGDIAQSTGPWARADWRDVVEALTKSFAASEAELEFGYRVPEQVMRLATLLLPHIAPGVTPARVIRSASRGPEIQWENPEGVVETSITAARKFAGNGYFVGLICADQDTVERLSSVMRHEDVSFTDTATGQLGTSINIMTAELSKGLEFDATVVVEPADIVGVDSSGLRHLYIALTRTTKYLVVVHSKQFELLGLHVGEPDPTDLTEIRSVAEPEAIDVSTDLPAASGALATSIGGTSTAVVSPAPVSLRDRILHESAKAIAEDIRAAVPAESHSALVSSLAKELGVDSS